MNTEQERAEFEVWAASKWPGVSFAPDQNNCGIVVPERYKHPKLQAAWEAYQAGRAALQSQDREDAERYRWLRRPDTGPAKLDSLHNWVNDDCHPPHRELKHGKELDKAIDHARCIEGEGK